MAERRIADRYEPLELLGRGGEATVVKAVDTRHGRLVALKVRGAGSGPSDEILNEARTLLALPSHPGLAHARDDLFDEGRHVLVLDWVDGIDLAHVLAGRGTPGLPVASVLRWAAQAAEALGVLHAHGVVHGDVKPANLILDRTGRVVLVDLGSSSVPDRVMPQGGTSGYRAPEIAGGAPPTRASDVFGLAATVFALLTGAPPTGGPPDWTGLTPIAASRLEEAIRAGLAIDPARRPATAGELVERLRAGWDDATPTGVDTVVLTDVVGSTELWERSPADVPALLATVQLAVDRCVEAHGGRRLGNTVEGDATISVFTSATAAVTAAVELQRMLRHEDGSMPIRVGIATGELVVVAHDVLGPTVNRAARVRELARPGEILLTGATADVVRPAPPAGVELMTLGPHHLRGIDGVEAVAAVVAAGIAAPPDPSRSPYPGLAPFTREQADLYVGRDDVIARCCELFERHRFVAVVGASGSGKSSLVHAGVAPRLGRCLSVRPGDDPIGALRSERVDHHPDDVLVVDQLEELLTQCTDDTARQAFVDTLVAHPGGAVVAVRADLYGELATFPDLAAALAGSQVLLGPLSTAEVIRAVEEPAHRCGLEVEPGLAEVIAAELGHAPGALPLLGHALRETWLQREGRTITLDAYRSAGGVASAIAFTAERALGGLDGPSREVARQLLLRMVELRRDGDDVRRWTSRHSLGADDDDSVDTVVDALADARLLVIDGDHVTVAHEALLREWPTLREWIDAERSDLLARQELRSDAERWVADGRRDGDLYRGARLDAAVALSSRTHLPEPDRAFIEAGRALRATEQDEARRRTSRLRVLAGVASAFALVAAAVGVVAARQRDEAQRARSEAESSASDAAAAAAIADEQRDEAESSAQQADAAAQVAEEQRIAAEAATRDAQIEALVGRAGSIRVTQRDTAALLAAQAFLLADTPTTRSALLTTFTDGDGFLDTQRPEALQAQRGGSGIVLPDGETAFVTDSDGRLRRYDLESGATGEPLDSIAAIPNSYPVLEASPDGRFLAQVAWQGNGDEASANIAVFDVASGVLRFSPVVIDGGVTEVTFAADGSLLFAAVFPDASVIAIDTTTGTVEPVAPGLQVDEPYANFFSMATTGDDVVIATSRPGTLRVIDAAAETVRHTHVLPDGFGDYLLDVGDGTVVAAGPAGIARVEVESGATRWRRDAPGACGPVLVIAARDLVFCGNVFGRLDERDLDTGLVVRRIGSQNGNSGLLWAADGGRELVSFGQNEPVVSRWRLDGTGPITTAVAPGSDPVEFGPDSRLLIVDRGVPPVDYVAEVVDVTSGAVVADLGGLLGHQWLDADTVSGAVPSADGTSGELAHVDLTGGGVQRDGVRLQPFPSRAEVTEGKQHSLLVWDGPDGPELRTFDPSTGDLGTPIRPGPINAFSVSGSGHRVVVGSALEDGGVEVYDGDTGELLAQLGDGARAGYLTPADQLFVTSFGGELTLHDLDTLEVVRTFGGSLGFIQSVVGTIDGDIVAARGGDRSLTLFDVESGVRLGTPLTIPDEAFDLFALAPDGSRLAVSSLDGTLVWELDPERWLDAACRVAGRNLTREEWATNIGDLAPYAATCPELPLDP